MACERVTIEPVTLALAVAAAVRWYAPVSAPAKMTAMQPPSQICPSSTRNVCADPDMSIKSSRGGELILQPSGITNCRTCMLHVGAVFSFKHPSAVE
jgi:hypothetical protein